jgi:hypothetical protein
MINLNIPVPADANDRAHAFVDEFIAALAAEPKPTTGEAKTERLAEVVMTAATQLAPAGLPVQAVYEVQQIMGDMGANEAFGAGFFVGAGLALRFMQHQFATGVTCSSKGDC